MIPSTYTTVNQQQINIVRLRLRSHALYEGSIVSPVRTVVLFFEVALL